MKASHAGYGWLLDGREGFRPRTQATALKAIDEQLLPPEAYIQLAVNIRPIFEEPFDLMELERLLARKDQSFQTTMLLMRIFERLIKDPDKELALFAAESINAIEVRYTKGIQLRKKALGEAQSAGVNLLRQLVRDHYELGLLCFSRPVLKQFYLAEAWALACQLPAAADSCVDGFDDAEPGEAAADPPQPPAVAPERLSDEDTELLVRIRLEQGKQGAARAWLEGQIRLHGREPFLEYLLAEVLYLARDYRQAGALLARLDDSGIEPRIRLTSQFWTGAGHG